MTTTMTMTTDDTVPVTQDDEPIQASAGEPVTTPGFDLSDRRTHVERINGPLLEALAVDVDPDAPFAPYRLLRRGVHDGRLLPAGSLVMLRPHEVGAHHAPIDPEA